MMVCRIESSLLLKLCSNYRVFEGDSGWRTVLSWVIPSSQGTKLAPLTTVLTLPPVTRDNGLRDCFTALPVLRTQFNWAYFTWLMTLSLKYQPSNTGRAKRGRQSIYYVCLFKYYAIENTAQTMNHDVVEHSAALRSWSSRSCMLLSFVLKNTFNSKVSLGHQPCGWGQISCHMSVGNRSIRRPIHPRCPLVVNRSVRSTNAAVELSKQ